MVATIDVELSEHWRDDIEELESRLEALDSKRIDPDVEVSDHGDIAELDSRLEKLENQHREANIDVDSRGATSTEERIDRVARDRTANIAVNKIGESGVSADVVSGTDPDDVFSDTIRVKAAIDRDSDVEFGDAKRNVKELSRYLGETEDSIKSITEDEDGLMAELDVDHRVAQQLRSQDAFDRRFSEDTIRVDAHLSDDVFERRELDRIGRNMNIDDIREIHIDDSLFTHVSKDTGKRERRLRKANEVIDTDFGVIERDKRVFEADDGNLRVRELDLESDRVIDWDVDRMQKISWSINDNDVAEIENRLDFELLDDEEREILKGFRDDARKKAGSQLGPVDRFRRLRRQMEFDTYRAGNRLQEKLDLDAEQERRIGSALNVDMDRDFLEYGPDDDRRISFYRRANKQINRLKKSLGKAIPSMHTWHRLLAAAIPLLITFATHALGVAAAMGAVAVAGAGLLTGLLGHGEDLNSSLEEAKSQAKELGEELFGVFQPTFQILAPAQERLFQRLPQYARPLAESMEGLLAYEDSVNAMFSGIIGWVADFVDVIVDMEDTIEGLTSRFGPILGDNLLAGFRWLIEEADKNQDMLVRLGSTFLDLAAILYHLSMIMAEVLIMFAPLIGWIRGLLETGRPLITTILKIAAVMAVFGSGTMKLIGLIKFLAFWLGVASKSIGVLAAGMYSKLIPAIVSTEMALAPLLAKVLLVTAAILALWELIGDAPMMPDFGGGHDGPGNDLWGGGDGGFFGGGGGPPPAAGAATIGESTMVDPNAMSGNSGGYRGGGTQTVEGRGGNEYNVNIHGNVGGEQDVWAMEDAMRRVAKEEANTKWERKRGDDGWSRKG